MTRALDRWEHASWAIPMLAGLATATLGAMAVDAAVQSPAAASWVYLLVVLPVALRWGRAVGVTTALLAAVLLLTHTPAGQARQAASSTQPRTAPTAPGLTQRSRWSTSGVTG